VGWLFDGNIGDLGAVEELNDVLSQKLQLDWSSWLS